MIWPYLSDTINDHETQSEWKIQLTMHINFISSRDSDETRTMHTKSHNIEIMMGNETDKIIEKLSESLLQNYQKDLEESMTGSEFVPDSIDLLYYHLQKIGLKRGGSYIDSSEWLKNKKATINPKTMMITAFSMFNHCITLSKHWKKNLQRISKKYTFYWSV